MRIGIDARLLIEPLTGIGRYTEGMCEALLKHKCEFFLYMPSKPSSNKWSEIGASVRASYFVTGIGRMLWSQVILPLNVVQDKVDVLWSATHRLPRYLPDKVARVVTVHDLVWKHAPETMRPLSRVLDSVLMADAIQIADRVIAVSHSTAQDIKSEWPAVVDKVRVIHPGGVDLPFTADARLIADLGIDKKYVLFVGTLEPRKNLARLLSAFAQLPEGVRAETILVIAGGKGWGGIDAHRLVADLRLSQNVILAGYVSDSVLSALYSNAHLLAMPSLYEGFGLPVVEAMSRGVPVLVSDISSLPEVAGDAGLLVDPFDVDSIANGLLRILTDKVLHASLANSAVASANRFSWSLAARRALGVFAEAVEERYA